MSNLDSKNEHTSSTNSSPHSHQSTSPSSYSSSPSSTSSSSPCSPHQKPLPFTDVPARLVKLYPDIQYKSYVPNMSDSPINILTLFHNAARREISDYLSTIIPSLKAHYSKYERKRSFHKDFEHLRIYWDATVRYFFFIADIDEDICQLSLDSIRMKNDVIYSNFEKKLRLIRQRYSFAMEYVFRIADEKLTDFCEKPVQQTCENLITKLDCVSRFMLECMKYTDGFISDVNAVYDLQIINLEYAITQKLHVFAKDRIKIFFIMSIRWMRDEEIIKNWLNKFGDYKSLKTLFVMQDWKLEHYEQRQEFIDNLKQNHL